MRLRVEIPGLEPLLVELQRAYADVVRLTIALARAEDVAARERERREEADRQREEARTIAEAALHKAKGADLFMDHWNRERQMIHGMDPGKPGTG